MPMFSLDINGVDQDAIEGYEVWSGPLPPPGVYDGKLKVAQVVVIDPDNTRHSKNSGKNRIKIGVELSGNTGELAQYNGYVAWSGVNLVESGIGYINQWLKALTDGSDEEFTEIKERFYGGFVTDEKKEHITAIGPWKVESPDGELPIKIALKTRNRTVTDSETGKETVRPGREIASFLVRSGGSSATGGVSDEPVAEAEAPELPDDDEDYSDSAEDSPVMGEAEPEGGDVFDDLPEPADA